MCTNFQTKRTSSNCLAQICQKIDFEVKNFKNLSLDSESACLRDYVHQFSDKTDKFEFFGPNLPKNRFWDQNFKRLSLDSQSASLRYCVYQFSDKNFDFLGTNLPKNGFWGRNFENLNLDSESASLRYFVHHFQTKRRTLNVLAQICQKIDFGVKILKV